MIASKIAIALFTTQGDPLIRVLHIIGAMDRAGAETFLMNLYRSIDRNKVQFDFLVNAEGHSDYDDEIEALGGRIFRVPRYNLINRKRYAEAVRNIFQEHPEDIIVHSHIGSAAPVHLKVAREEGRFTIAHSHAQTKMDSLEDILFHFVSKPVRGRADWYMACSSEAAEDRFGETIARSDACTVIQNGIYVENYQRTQELTAHAKHDLKVEGRPVFGHIGRFTYDKNHTFLLDAFTNIKAQLPDATLLLIGRGELEADIRRAVKERGLEDGVVFLGIRDDIPHVLHAMDVFLFPSHHEGLGIAFIEAQAAGLECIASTGIPTSAVCTDRAERLPLDSPQCWATKAIGAYNRTRNQRDDRINAVKDAGYDITQIAAQLEEFYSRAAASSPRTNSSGA